MVSGTIWVHAWHKLVKARLVPQAEYELAVWQDPVGDAWSVFHRRSGWVLRWLETEGQADELAIALATLDWDFEEQSECPQATLEGLTNALAVLA